MQLKRKRRRRLQRTLLASSCALLGTAQNAVADTGDWKLDTGLLYYTEVDGIRAIEPTLLAQRDFGDGDFLKLNFTVDSLTGATPTGAMPSSKSQTATGASGGGGGGTQAPGTTPVDNKFKDFRRAVSATWSQPLSEAWRWDAGANYSIEYDYKSLGANTLFSRDFDGHNTTLSGGVFYEYDDIFPVGGIPSALSQTPQAAPIASDRTKTVKGALLGLSQVMSHDWIVKLNFSYGGSSGYLNDPYKVVSVLNTHLGGANPIGGIPIFGPPIGEPLFNIYENRPDSRHERALFVENKVYINGDVLDLSYRYSWDDWDIHSNTVELRYRWSLGGDYFLQPHLRYYRQSAANFYHRGLLDSDSVPQFVSADYRLAAFTARTVGVEFGTRFNGGQTLSLRVEHYSQGGGSDPHVVIGEQQGYDLFPGLSANIVQFDYTF